MPGTILENLSGKKISVLVIILIACQLASFLVGLIAPKPASSQQIIATVCVDEKPDLKDHEKFFTKSCPRRIELRDETQTRGLSAGNLVFVAQMPQQQLQDFSRWQQNLIGVLQLDFVLTDEQKVVDPIIEVTLNARLAYRNKNDRLDAWKYYAHSEERRFLDCDLENTRGKDNYPFSCSTVPLFELGTLYHDYYLLNLRLPFNESANVNTRLPRIHDLTLHMIHMNGGYTKIWVSLKTVFFPILLAIMLWFWRRVHILSRTPALLEYMLISVGAALAFLDLPLEYLSLYFEMPYMLLLSDIRQGIFYAMLLSFWLVFAGEHMLIQDNGEKNSIRMYWQDLSTIVIGCLSLLVFDLCERGFQLINPFYSIWVTPIGTNLALTFIILAGISASMYFIFLCYKIWKVFRNISIKRSVLPSMSSARRLHYEGIIYRFNFLMLTTVICAAITVISFILSQISEGQNKWDENMEFELSSALHTGVYGMWNVYICGMLILYAPSHKQWPADPICGEAGEEVEFSRLPTDPSPNEISSLTSFASKANID